ncbi:hypothetical protein NXS19_012543 [Fusarium pseudograminearum]|nr:hypothetical protein NXS19_012543 [Fusarium pseudograminearum]
MREIYETEPFLIPGIRTCLEDVVPLTIVGETIQGSTTNTANTANTDHNDHTISRTQDSLYNTDPDSRGICRKG